jgi:queuine/archaeosine tRNA-ribosyltransferase
MQFKSTEFLKELVVDLAVESGVDLTDSKLTIKTSVKDGLIINEGKFISNNEMLEASVKLDVNTRAVSHVDTIQCQLHLDSEAEEPEKTKQAKLLIAMLCNMYCLPYDYTIKF